MTLLVRYVPDTLMYPNSKSWDYRYLVRVKDVERRLKITPLQNGTGNYQLRFYRFSSAVAAQQLFIVQKRKQKWYLQKIFFDVDPETWDERWRGKDSVNRPKVLHLKKNQELVFSSALALSLSLDSLWLYQSQTGKDYLPFDQRLFPKTEDNFSVCLEIADQRRYHFLFYRYPFSQTNLSKIFYHITRLYKSLNLLHKSVK